MKLYKMFDQNGIYPAFWCSDVEKVIYDWEYYADSYADEYDVGYTAELRFFDTWDIDPKEYHAIAVPTLRKSYHYDED